ncbi:MAG: S-methyl-5-thioribose-1-phosphate isomerase [Candidatus Omnitrophica bacterium]|nr:S-methyl-5-thioribose-1-phosphate isomerase [Candidatus Omnitrophota bacterium]
MSVKTIQYLKGKIRIIDQRKLPAKLCYMDCADVKSLWWAIKRLAVRGAPAIGIAAGLGVYLGIKDSRAKDFKEFKSQLEKVTRYLAKSRPTAVNLFWALERMTSIAKKNSYQPIPVIKKLLKNEAFKILEEDRFICRKMARYGSGLIKNQDKVLTICNAGALATADYGTALGVFYEAKKERKRIKVYSLETRPLLQGARLTCWELQREGIDVTLICDNMAADLMRKKMIDKIFVGADRIARNGDTANKIGTYNLAVLARFHAIPFYVVAPKSTFDLKLKSAKFIPIEQRDKREVTHIRDRCIAPSRIKVYNPAFDVTPAELITAIVTEKGIIRHPLRKNITAKL